MMPHCSLHSLNLRCSSCRLGWKTWQGQHCLSWAGLWAAELSSCAPEQADCGDWASSASPPAHAGTWAQVFKIALDYWNFFVPDVYASVSTGLADANAAFAFGGPGAAGAGRRQLYSGVLSKLRLLMISRMAKPEEARSRLMHFVRQSYIAVSCYRACLMHPARSA
jgi:hypothetical protein